MPRPDPDDVVVRQKSGNPSVHVIGTLSAPAQCEVGTREEAVSQAVALATRQHVRAWFAAGGVDYVLLGTFRTEDVEPPRPS